MRLIDADELLIKLQWHCDLNCPYTERERDIMCDACFLGAAKDEIESTSTVDAEPIRHGRWIYKEVGYPLSQNFYICSECGYPHGLAIDNYCSHCGAKMDEEAAQ